jgi:uncharacterized protein (TIGR03067 family)
MLGGRFAQASRLSTPRSNAMILSPVALVAVSLFVAADAAEEATKKDLAALQGVWRLVSLDLTGERRETGEVKVHFEGTKVFHEKEGEKKEIGSIRLDAAVSPKIMDFKPLEGEAIEGTYLIEGDKLSACFVQKGDARPVDFKPTPTNTVAIFERVK